MSNLDVTLAFPAFNESDVIRRVVGDAIASLDDLGVSFEVIVIDNASTDDTASIVGELAADDERIRVIRHEENRLYSGSCATAIAAAAGSVLAIVDSDGQADIDDLGHFIETIEAGADLVIGWRHRRRDGLRRAVMSRVFNLLGRFYLGYPHHDLNCGFRAMNREAIKAMEIRHRINMANPELYVRATLAGLTVDEVEIRHYPRADGGSTHDFKRLGRIFRGTTSYMRSLRRELRAAD